MYAPWGSAEERAAEGSGTGLVCLNHSVSWHRQTRASPALPSHNVLNLHDWVPKLRCVQILSLWELAPWQHSQCFLCSFLMDWPWAPELQTALWIYMWYAKKKISSVQQFCGSQKADCRADSVHKYWAISKGEVGSTQDKATCWQRTAYETRCSVCFKRLKGRVYVLRTFYFFFSFYNLEEHVFTKSLCQRWR